MKLYNQWIVPIIVGIVIVGIATIICIQIVRRIKYRNGQIDFYNEVPPKSIIKSKAYCQVKYDFGKTGQKFYLKNGELSASAKKSIAAKTDEISSLITSVNYQGIACCSQEFIDFVILYSNKYGLKPIRKNFKQLVSAYLSEGLPDSIDNFLSRKQSLSVNQFFALRKSSKYKEDFVGVYIIYNATKAMYYVGQATRVLFRLNQHFTGRGNGDVYADFKYGNEFTIQVIKLSESGTDDLDKLERTMIKHFNAYDAGYNKTAGNARFT